jgi:hypothetical protein
MIWPFTKIAELRHIISVMEEELNGADEHTDALEHRIKQLEVILFDTQTALRAALKNDTPQDAKTGKFTKKKTKDV